MVICTKLFASFTCMSLFLLFKILKLRNGKGILSVLSLDVPSHCKECVLSFNISVKNFGPFANFILCISCL